MLELAALDISKGSIVAPAGCGKTHLITECLKIRHTAKPILVLTHTNAGVAALRSRLVQQAVPRNNYALATLDGWAMRIVSMFPEKSGITSKTLQLSTPKNDYPAIKAAALSLLKKEHISELIASNYEHLFVDEYQDCLATQHAIVNELSKILPTCVFGDPLQNIFDFGDTQIDWDQTVLQDFPLQTELSTPHRWINAGQQDLGDWLLSIRSNLLMGQPIDLLQAPFGATWVNISSSANMPPILEATHSMPHGITSSIIICDSTNKRRQQKIARSTMGSTVVENAELSDLIDFVSTYEFSSKTATETLIRKAGDILRSVEVSKTIKRFTSLKSGTARKPPNEAEQAILTFDRSRTPKYAAAMLSAISKQPGVSIYREDVFRGLLKAFNSSPSPNDIKERAIKIREERRFYSRTIGKRAVGSTLLVKGLEADQVVIVDTQSLNAQNLYVALTRGAKRILVCSPSSTLQPS
ncbi:UvrD-helicase domain-containing protein [Flexibacterium corallicola]|uniref:UvrD-helicase domain-containing protein n=1 Tax=Flexibacterium corallicola TaxID=3037259 RepID=UPI00286F2911|nr:UvrD-helicase domain-containing protein [Pseudovibrio sp. M1P-2-3]